MKVTKKAIKFTEVETGVTYTIVFVPKHHPGLKSTDIHERYITSKSFEELTAGFTEEEVSAIETGKVVTGMAKEAVLVCYGYPPEVATPSTSANAWEYWRHRFKSFTLQFKDDKLTYIGS